MTGPTGIPRDIRWTVALGLLGLALAVPSSAPDGTGMQWDELVLACVAARSAWSVLRMSRGMDAAAARPWRIVGIGGVMFMTAQLLAGLFPGPEFDGFGIDDVILLAGASSPVVACALLGRQVRRNRWTALVLDGAVVTVALLVVTEVLRTPLVNPANVPEDLRSLVLAYGGYAAVMLGGAGALCTVSTAALRRSASVMIGAVACQASAACAEAMAIMAPSMLWVAMSDVSVAIGLQAVVLAAGYAPQLDADRSARGSAPRVSPWGLALVVIAMLGVPLAIAVSLQEGRPLSQGADAGIAVVLALIAVRLGLRIREDGRVSEDLVRNEEDFRSLVESSSDGVAIVDDEELRLLFTSPAARDMLGLVADGSHDCSLLDLVEPEDRALLRASIKDGGPVLHFRVTRGDGDPGELEATTSVRAGSDRGVLYLRDVTTRRSRERELERMAYTDHLTALPNRAQLFEDLNAPATAARCLLVVDLDGFKAVNDVAGHQAGDQLLVEVARRLNTVVRGDDLVARHGGDEFAVVVTGSVSEALEVAQRVVHVLAMPHRVGDWTFAVGASVGVARIEVAGGQIAFREADAALRAAKQAGKGCVRLADEDVPSVVVVPDGLDVDTVIEEGDFSLRLDAACDADGRIALVHAVPVWEHGVHGMLRGQDLWGNAERQGRSAELQRWLLREACSEAAGLPDERVAVAVSLPAGHVTSEGLSTEVADALAGSGLAPSRLVLAFTEETLLTSSAALVPELETARRTGVRLCLDNYGMGHSLFALLARISLDLVRVDVAALAARDDTERALHVLSSIVGSTSDFGLVAVAGAISTPELSAAAFEAGVDLVHGRNQPHDLSMAAVAQLVGGAEPVPSR
jgi:diguanylate cyclase (GGDEF)-like protein/PAS domain S-box-containing protein